MIFMVDEKRLKKKSMEMRFLSSMMHTILHFSVCNFLRRNISPYSTPFSLLSSLESSSRGFALTISKLQCYQLFILPNGCMIWKDKMSQKAEKFNQPIFLVRKISFKSWQHCQIPLYYVVIASKWRQRWRL